MDTRSLKHILCCFIGLLPPLTALADTFVGRVLDETGNPLPGAVVRVDGLKQPFVTDADGRYSFELPGENKAGITVSFNGYIPKSSVIRSSASRKKENVIRVVPDPTTLNEVVVTATRTPKSLKDVPVVTRVISADDIAKTDATDIQDASHRGDAGPGVRVCHEPGDIAQHERFRRQCRALPRGWREAGRRDNGQCRLRPSQSHRCGQGGDYQGRVLRALRSQCRGRRGQPYLQGKYRTVASQCQHPLPWRRPGVEKRRQPGLQLGQVEFQYIGAALHQGCHTPGRSVRYRVEDT